ncbi:MAG: hypothetical protein IPK16_07835 [Anaerolineales bacterium]|nr:hypothetical protein [Anaerolineales bacterium]
MDQVQNDEPKGNDDQQQGEYDSPWKVALRNLLPQFLAYFYPAVHAAVDWRREPVFLDKELCKLAPRRYSGSGRWTPW